MGLKSLQLTVVCALDWLPKQGQKALEGQHAVTTEILMWASDEIHGDQILINVLW